MFMMLLNGLAWLLVIGLAIIVLIFALAGAGALIGKSLVAIRDALPLKRSLSK